ncbi:pyrroline-5-carboxylate reductase [Dermacoccaceae bacterium W4C1]
MERTAERSAESRTEPVAIIGAGVMGETLAAGLLRSGRQPSQVLLCDKSADRLAAVSQKLHVQVSSAAEAVAQVGTVVLAVKPQDMGSALEAIAEHLQPGTLVLSIAAGITTSYLQERLPEGTPVARAMPNTPASVEEGMTAVSPGTYCEAHHIWVAQDLLRSFGKVITVSEDQLDAVTAISGSGPAYIFYVVEAMIEAGVLLGLPRGTSTELVVQTLFGAATMLKETGEHPTVLRERVSSPGGTTMAALRELDDHKVRAAFLTAMEAAARRSAELASGSA